jgi:hypothetical protein
MEKNPKTPAGVQTPAVASKRYLGMNEKLLARRE